MAIPREIMPFPFKCMYITIVLTIALEAKRTKKEDPGPVIARGDLRRNGIFRSLDSILEYLKLKEYRSQNTTKEIIKKYRRSLYIGKQLTEFLPGSRRRFIVIEGLYRKKRHVVAKVVARSIRGKHILNPYHKLANVSKLPTRFDTRRAYYSLTKYGVANLVPRLLKTHAVVMERYWLDQATFAIAKKFKTEFPSPDSDIFAWPKDLIKPDITFFLNADRFFNKSTSDTTVKNEVNNFTVNILKAYDYFKRRMPIYEISSKQHLMSMAKEIMTQIRQLGDEVVVVKKFDPLRPLALPD